MKQKEKTELTKQRIMTMAMSEFGTNGYFGASLNNICTAGISKGLFYHNFENKDSIYLACVGRCFSTLTDYLKEADTGSDLRHYMDARFQFFQEYEQEAHIFFEAVLQPPEHLQGQIAELRKGFDLLNLKLYQQMLSSVPLRQGVSEQDAMAYFTMMQNMFNSYFSSPSFRTMSFSDRMTTHETNLSKLLDFMLYGIAERR